MTNKLPIKDYITLINAGYTPDEINEYVTGGGQVSLSFTDKAAEVSEPVEVRSNSTGPADTERVNEEVKPVEPVTDTVSQDLLTELKLLRSDLQKQNIINDRLNIQPKDSAVDILASVVAPPKKER